MRTNMPCWYRTALLVAASLAASAGCTPPTETSEEDVAMGRATLTTTSAPEPTLQYATREKVDWPKLVGMLSKDNIFRILYAAQVNAKDRGDDGMWSLSPAEQKILAQFKADMDEVYVIHIRAGSNPLDADQSARVAKLQAPYVAARQELYKVLSVWPELSRDAREAMHTAVAQINASRAMQLQLPASVP